MTPEIAILLVQDGITTGAVYVLLALGIVLVFLVTRVVFVPFGDVVGYSALTLAALQLGKLPGTVWLVATLAVIATVIESVSLIRQGHIRRLPRALLLFAALPLATVVPVWLLAGRELPGWLQIVLTIALVLPISPLLYRIAFQSIADASILILLMVAVALHFAMSGLALLYFGPEGFRTKAMTNVFFDIGPVSVSAQSLLIVGASIAFSLLLFLFFERTLTGKALRATSVNRLGARLMGIRPTNTGAIAFLLASALAAISGILIGPVTTLYYDSGFLIGLKAFVGAIIGGLVSYPGAAVGAVLVGLLEAYSAFWSSALKEVIVFGALIPILVWRSIMTGGETGEEIEEEEREGVTG
jgi:branched-chain amino acid transport system permease protein